MKIVYCHNYYRHRGGEDVSFECDVEMLRDKGHAVVTFTRDNSDWPSGPLRMAQQTLWNRTTRAELAELLRREQPDILHCNNLFPQISMSVYAAARRLGIPIVQALRNYRSFCANSYLYRDRSVCTKCLNSNAAWHGLRYGCYRNSRVATSVVVAMQLLHRILGTQKRAVDVFFTPSQFARQVYIDGGFAPESIMVRNNFILPDLGLSNEDHGYALFIGRLSDEKGVDTLLRAWTENNFSMPLRIVGSGPDEVSLKTSVAGHANISFLGHLDKASVLQQLAQASFLVMPSRWYETFGRAIVEAYSRGKPVIAARLGAMSELVQDGATGFLFDPTSPTDLAAAAMKFMQLDENKKQSMRLAARAEYDQRLSPEASYQSLLKIYEYALRNKV